MSKITLFGLGGSGTSTLAKEFSSKYGFEFKSSGGLFREKAKEMGLSLSEFADLCLEDSKYDRELDKKTAEYGEAHDNFIFESRLAWHFIPYSLKVKIYCDPETRAKRIVQREGGIYEDVLKKTLRRDEIDRLRYEKIYGIADYDNDAHFDLVLDSRYKSPSELAVEIHDFLETMARDSRGQDSKNL